MLPLIFKEKTVQFLVSCSIGHQNSTYFRQEDDPSANTDAHRQSISCERTFMPPSRDSEVLRSLLLEIIENLQEDVQRVGIIGCGSVGVKLKSADFKVSTREKRTDTLSRQVDWSFILKTVERLMDDFLESDSVVEIRLLGVRLSKLKFETQSPHESSVLAKWLHKAANTSKNTAAICPVCNCAMPFAPEDHRATNEHLDECLTRASLKENKGM